MRELDVTGLAEVTKLAPAPADDLDQLVLQTLLDDSVRLVQSDGLMGPEGWLGNTPFDEHGDTVLSLRVVHDERLYRLDLRAYLGVVYQWDGAREHRRLVEIVTTPGVGPVSLGTLLSRHRDRIPRLGRSEPTPEEQERDWGPSDHRGGASPLRPGVVGPVEWDAIADEGDDPPPAS
jgi:hypothetical protein